MALVEFKNYPSTETPLNAENLNNNFNEVNKVNVKNDASLLMSSSDIIPITPKAGSNYSTYGNSYYYKKGTRVHVHLGLQGLTPNASNVVFEFPEGYRPKNVMSIIGLSQGVNDIIGGQAHGYIQIYPTHEYALFDFEFDVFN